MSHDKPDNKRLAEFLKAFLLETPLQYADFELEIGILVSAGILEQGQRQPYRLSKRAMGAIKGKDSIHLRIQTLVAVALLRSAAADEAEEAYVRKILRKAAIPLRSFLNIQRTEDGIEICTTQRTLLVTPDGQVSRESLTKRRSSRNVDSIFRVGKKAALTPGPQETRLLNQKLR